MKINKLSEGRQRVPELEAGLGREIILDMLMEQVIYEATRYREIQGQKTSRHEIK